MKFKWLLLLPVALISCIDITDEILIKAEGGGVFQRTTDYTSAFAGIENSEDSLAMAKQAENDHQNLKKKFSSVNGVHNVNYSNIPGTHQYRIGFEYDNYPALNRALLEDGDPGELFIWKKGVLEITGGIAGMRSSQPDDTAVSGRAMLANALKDANYNLIITAPRKIKKCSNHDAVKKGNILFYNGKLDELIFHPELTKMTIKYK